MNRNEFKTWWDSYADHFPETAAWLNTLGPAHKERTKGFWAETLDDVDFALALTVTKLIAKGDEPAIKAYERDSTAAHVRKIAMRLRSEQMDEQAQATSAMKIRSFSRRQRLATGNLARVLERVWALKTEGMEPTNAFEQASIELPECFPEDDEQYLPRYRCNRCRSTGVVDVWSNKAFHLARLGTLTGKEGKLVASAFCDCQAGERSQEVKGIVRYDPENLCLCPYGDTTSIDNRVAFMQWVERWRPRNYDRTFDEYNAAF